MTHYRIHPDAHMGRVQLKVSQIERSIRFYHDVIGLTLIAQTEKTAEFGVKGSGVLLGIEEVANAQVMQQQSVTGLYHFAILLPDRASLGTVLRHLAESGMSIGQGDHLVSEAFYLNDPDGNGIEIYADRPRSQWQKDANGEYIMGTDPVDVDSLLQLAGVWNGLPAGTVIGHVHLHVGNLPAARKFYVDGLGFDVVLHFGGSALFVSAGGYHHHMGLNTWAGVGAPAAPANAVGLSYFTIEYPNAEECSRAAAALQAAGIEVTDTPEGPSVLDPFGNRAVLRVS
ncbi:VOC family protein [Saccharibacillus kuerlensis]|uniref:Catechol-2,3-dioxygenase n=1 Tax=Saccharibacillus kuerlensis TaxID=459527 RepID=A0ABQ2KRC5_9BACL|nr:VOC family protein [Saccharibacillus kuerlensis]GGN90808.1 catechol-2,3-dioxygenase [Saccharibacillus kuerlensis]